MSKYFGDHSCSWSCIIDVGNRRPAWMRSERAWEKERGREWKRRSEKKNYGTEKIKGISLVPWVIQFWIRAAKPKSKKRNYIAEEQPSSTTTTTGITVFSFLLQIHEGKNVEWNEIKKIVSLVERRRKRQRQRHRASISRKEFFAAQRASYTIWYMRLRTNLHTNAIYIYYTHFAITRLTVRLRHYYDAWSIRLTMNVVRLVCVGAAASVLACIVHKCIRFSTSMSTPCSAAKVVWAFSMIYIVVCPCVHGHGHGHGHKPVSRCCRVFIHTLHAARTCACIGSRHITVFVWCRYSLSHAV